MRKESCFCDSSRRATVKRRFVLQEVFAIMIDLRSTQLGIMETRFCRTLGIDAKKSLHSKCTASELAIQRSRSGRFQ